MRTITLENGEKVKISEESYLALAKATQEILVPEEIKICENEFSEDGLAIAFESGMKQKELVVSEKDGWEVFCYENCRGKRVPCKLVPVKPEDRKAGYTYFRHDIQLTKELLQILDLYCKYLGNGKYACITEDQERPLCLGQYSWDYWYQVVPVEASDD